MANFQKNLKRYLSSPESIMFGVFLLLAALVLGLNFYLLELVWALLVAAVFVVFGVGLFVVSFRISRKNLQMRVEKSRVDNIISSMTDGVIIYDENFKVLLFSGAAENIFHLDAGEVMGRKFSPEDANSEKYGVLAKVIFQSLAPLVVRHTPEGEYPQIADISFEDPHVELRVITERVMNEDGERTGFVKIVHDQTRIADLLKSKSEFITIAAHQLRTPLSAIGWGYQTLKNEPLTESQKEIVAMGLAASNNLSRIVDDLLNVSKVEEGRFGYDFKKIDIVSFLQSALSQAVPVAKEYGVDIFMDTPPEPSIDVYADPEKLSLVISNLLENAVKYNVPNGKVVVGIEVRSGEPFVQVSVSDTGLGIPEESMDKLFTKFFRAENVTKKETAGSGLGLYIARNIIRQHGGEIWAESVLNRGTTFYFTLPTDRSAIPQLAYTKASE